VRPGVVRAAARRASGRAHRAVGGREPGDVDAARKSTTSHANVPSSPKETWGFPSQHPLPRAGHISLPTGAVRRVKRRTSIGSQRDRGLGPPKRCDCEASGGDLRHAEEGMTGTLAGRIGPQGISVRPRALIRQRIAVAAVEVQARKIGWPSGVRGKRRTSSNPVN